MNNIIGYRIIGHPETCQCVGCEAIKDCDRFRSELAAKDARIAELEAGQICGACGHPWDGQGCAQKDNGHPFQTCYPVVNESPLRADNEALRKELAEVKQELDEREAVFIGDGKTIGALRKELAASRKWNQDVLDAARETRPDDDRRAAEWGLAVFAALKKLEGEFEAYKVYYEYNDVDLDMAVECEVKERDATRKELAEAKAALAHANAMNRFEEGTRITLTDQVDVQLAEIKLLKIALEAAKSRIAELEERNRECRDAATRISGEITARAERAEARAAELEAVNADLRRWKALDKPLTAAMAIANINTQQHIARAERAEAKCKAMREASEGIGFWLSAALDDRGACDAMKTDIRAWFAALNPFPADPG